MKKKNKQTDQEVWEHLVADPHARQEAARKNLMIFYLLYRSREGALYDLADFHKEIISILQDPEHTFFILEGARGSGKTTLAVYMNAIWSIVGEQQLKHVLIITRNYDQACTCMDNIKFLMMQEPLCSDMGPFKESGNIWGPNSIDVPKYGARITVLSIEQQIRGISYNGIRPQLIIADDLENYTLAKSPEIRKVRRYIKLFSQIVPAGDTDTRYIVIWHKIA